MLVSLLGGAGLDELDVEFECRPLVTLARVAIGPARAGVLYEGRGDTSIRGCERTTSVGDRGNILLDDRGLGSSWADDVDDVPVTLFFLNELC